MVQSRGFLASILTTLTILITAHVHSAIHEHGFWFGDDIGGQHQYDPTLAQTFTKFFNAEGANTIVDFGCGRGDYLDVLLSAGFDCQGYDGNPDTYTMSNGIADVIDLSAPFDLHKQYDWVICLEVGEHLPKQYESTLLDNLDRHVGKGIVISWAVLGQGGYGHFNTQDNWYVKEQMHQRGYINDEEAEKTLRDGSTLSWFKNTIMVFRKPIYTERDRKIVF